MRSAALLCSLGPWLLAIAVAGPSHAQIIVTAEYDLAGTIASVAEGRISIRDPQDELHDLLIEPRPGQGILLSDGKLLRMPADVQVSGEYALELMQSGEMVRLELSMNRRGDVEQPISEVWKIGKDDASTGVFPQSEPADVKDFVSIGMTAAFQRAINGRLLVKLPRNSFTRKKTISIQLNSDAKLRFASHDYLTTAAGAKVDRATVAKLNTGDSVIRTLRVTMSEDSTAKQKYDDAIELKYRDVSDEPLEPRTVRSRHFLLQTDISLRQEKILMEKLERMVGLLSAYFGRKPTGLVQGYVVRDLSQWPPGSLPEPEGIAKIKQGAGICFWRRQGKRAEATIYTCDDQGVTQHESTHAFCALAFGSTGPTWLAEGVAEMGQYWKADETAVNIGPGVLQYLQRAKPKRTLGEIAVPGRTPAGGWQDYAWRWALCHLLANNPNYSDRFKPLAMALMSGQEGVSFASVYGPVEQQISFEYDQFLANLDLGYEARLCAWQWDQKFAPLRGSRPAKAKILANYGWQASGVRLSAGTKYEVAAEGDWKITPKGKPLSADGDTAGRGQLVGAVLHDFQLSEPFQLGASASFTAPVDGDLYLRCNDAWNGLADNEGQLTVNLRLPKRTSEQ